LAALSGAAVGCGCVAGAELRPSQAQAKSGPPARAAGASAGALLLAAPAAPDAGSPVTESGRRWVRGYWHWNGVRYVYVPARLEPARTVSPARGARDTR
jgi:hypothetical protein